MANGITLGIVIVVILLIGGFVLTLLINAFLVPLFKTPKNILEQIVDIMNLKKGDHLVDLGSGDGRLLLKAHRFSKCKCTGYDISPIMLIIAKTNLFLQFPFTKDIVFEPEDIFKVNFKNFSKVYCYLDRKSLDILKTKMDEFVKNGGEIYSYRHGIQGIKNEKKIVLSDDRELYIYTNSKSKDINELNKE